MELLFITFSKVSEKLIKASLSLRNDKKSSVHFGNRRRFPQAMCF